MSLWVFCLAGSMLVILSQDFYFFHNFIPLISPIFEYDGLKDINFLYLSFMEIHGFIKHGKMGHKFHKRF